MQVFFQNNSNLSNITQILPFRASILVRFATGSVKIARPRRHSLPFRQAGRAPLPFCPAAAPGLAPLRGAATHRRNVPVAIRCVPSKHPSAARCLPSKTPPMRRSVPCRKRRRGTMRTDGDGTMRTDVAGGVLQKPMHDCIFIYTREYLCCPPENEILLSAALPGDENGKTRLPNLQLPLRHSEPAGAYHVYPRHGEHFARARPLPREVQRLKGRESEPCPPPLGDAFFPYIII